MYNLIIGVLLYFTEMMEAHGNELAIYVSCNKEIKHFPEDECEGMVMFVKLF